MHVVHKLRYLKIDKRGVAKSYGVHWKCALPSFSHLLAQIISQNYPFQIHLLFRFSAKCIHYVRLSNSVYWTTKEKHQLRLEWWAWSFDRYFSNFWSSDLVINQKLRVANGILQLYFFHNSRFYFDKQFKFLLNSFCFMYYFWHLFFFSFNFFINGYSCSLSCPWIECISSAIEKYFKLINILRRTEQKPVWA